MGPLAETSEERQARIATIQSRVVGMYSKHPWPGTRRTDEEMGWRLKVIGVTPKHYVGRRVVDVGCGTGDYALWYAAHGASHVPALTYQMARLLVHGSRRTSIMWVTSRL